MLIVDLRHWLLPNGDLAPQAKLAPHVASVVEIASAAIAPGLSNMPCRRKSCAGRIGVATEDGFIFWGCSVCDDDGRIQHWQHTRWDLSGVDVGPDEEELVAFVPLDELRAVRDLDLPDVIRAVLAVAPVVQERACVTLTEAEIATLLEALQAAGRRHLLIQARGRFDQVLAAEQVPRRARAH